MKALIFIVFLVNFTFANYAYENQTKGKIDMHGGKNSSLFGDKSSFSNSNFNSLGKTLKLEKPKKLKKEAIEIKEKKREVK